jgi:hypothetical protein
VHDIEVIPMRDYVDSNPESAIAASGDSIDDDSFVLVTACGDSSSISRIDSWLTSFIMSWETTAPKMPNGSVNVWPFRLSQLRALGAAPKEDGSSSSSTSPSSNSASQSSSSSPSSSLSASTAILTSKPASWYANYLRKSFCHHIEPQAVSLCSDPQSGRIWVGSSDGQIVLHSLSSKAILPSAAADADGTDHADEQKDESSLLVPSSPASAAAASVVPPLRSCILKHGFNLPHANLNWVSEMVFDAGRNTLFAVSHDKIITVRIFGTTFLFHSFFSFLKMFNMLHFLFNCSEIFLQLFATRLHGFIVILFQLAVIGCLFAICPGLFFCSRQSQPSISLLTLIFLFLIRFSVLSLARIRNRWSNSTVPMIACNR